MQGNDPAARQERLSDQSVEEILLECLRVLSSEEDYDKAFGAFLDHLSRYYRADRAYIFEFDRERELASNTYEWCRPGVTAQKDALQGVPLKTLTRWTDLFKHRGRVYIGDLDKDVDHDSAEYAILKPQGIKSLLAAPLHKGDVFVGFLGVDNPSRHEDDFSLLSASTDFIVEELRKRELIERLERASYIDMLTGLNNRNSYGETLDRLESERPASLGVIFTDVNGMKRANDEHGHAYGDKILQLAADCLKRVDAHRAYRIGGDEFVMLFEDISEEGLLEKVTQLRAEFAQEPRCDMSVGHAWASGEFELVALTGAADKMMYAEKHRLHAEGCRHRHHHHHG